MSEDEETSTTPPAPAEGQEATPGSGAVQPDQPTGPNEPNAAEDQPTGDEDEV